MTLEDLERVEVIKSAAEKLMKTDSDYRSLRSRYHPDRYPAGSNDQSRAEKVFIKLGQLWELLQQPTIILKSKTAEYALGDLLGTGDVSEVYRASSGSCHDYVAKVSRIPGGDLFVSKESQYLRLLNKKADGTTYANYHPRLVDSFLWDDGFQKRVNIFREPFRLWSLQAVIEKLGKLDVRHCCWIFRRLLTGLGFAHLQNVVHGAVLPQHVLIEPENHGVCLCGWIHAVEPKTLVSIVPSTHKSWYPPEVIKQTYAGPETDIYLAAKTIIEVGDWDAKTQRIKLFLESLLVGSPAMRPKDAWKLEEEFSLLMDSTYGVRRFIPLVLN